MSGAGEGAQRFRAARDALLHRYGDPLAAAREFRWPELGEFNWARDHFDALAVRCAQPALRVVDDAGLDHSVGFAALARRSCQVANLLAAQGVRRGDRVLIALGNVVPLWEAMLAVMRLGAVIVPATTLLQAGDLEDRIVRGRIRAVIATAALAARLRRPEDVAVRIVVDGAAAGWLPYAAADGLPATFEPEGTTQAGDLLLLYFTSGTTANPKLVAHTHASYPVGHLSTMYWLGLRPGDLHLNLSSPGWAKHAWSNFFAPWNAEATVLAYQYERFQARALLDQLVRCGVTSFCAPPTVWRMLVQEPLARWRVALREVASAGEPLNPEVIEQVRAAWGLTIRDGYGQTETTAQIGNPPGAPVKPGSMGRPLPGYTVELLDGAGRPASEGEVCLDLAARPLGLMRGYLDDAERTAAVMRDGWYHTGDVARRDADGSITFIGRTDDVFKSSDYRISPFELESVLVEHPAVAEAAVVPSPDAIRLSVPKAFVMLAAGHAADAATAASILAHVRARVPGYQRIRRLEFAELPKTISGKIRRVELRGQEMARTQPLLRAAQEHWEEDFPAAGSTG
jgi:acetyl-CoA synthetase